MEKEPNKAEVKESWWDLLKFAVIALAIVIPIRLFVAQPFVVSGSSMFPTFHDGEYLIVDQLSYNLGSPERGDVAIFKYPKNTAVFYIKRIIGLPGETVDLKNGKVTIINKDYPEGLELDQPFIKNQGDSSGHYDLGDSDYFVMGDNR